MDGAGDDVVTRAYAAEDDCRRWPQLGRKTNKMFDVVYKDMQPSLGDRQVRESIIRFLSDFVIVRVPGISCATPFGSYTMEMYTPRSDLDISLKLTQPDCGPEEMLRFLKKFRRSLYVFHAAGRLYRKKNARVEGLRGVYHIRKAFSARVPVVKFIDAESGVEVDVSVENVEGERKSCFIRSFCSIDFRVRHLCFMIKKWAAFHEINDSREGTLSSLALTLLAVFHLQTRSLPILPPVERQSWRFNNKESVPELFRSFLFKMFSVENLWNQGLCASIYEGRWTSVNETRKNKSHYILVEDFLDRSQNVACTVNKRGFQRICSAATKTLHAFHRPSTLREQLFGFNL